MKKLRVSLFALAIGVSLTMPAFASSASPQEQKEEQPKTEKKKKASKKKAEKKKAEEPKAQ